MNQVASPARPSPPAFSQDQTLSHARVSRRAISAPRALMYSLFRLYSRLNKTKRIWCEAFHSFRGHIRLESSIDSLISWGPAFSRDQAGYLVPNKRTDARAEYTEKLWATHPWADTVDLRMFLMGFDAGEEWARRSTDRESSVAVQNHSQQTSDDGVS